MKHYFLLFFVAMALVPACKDDDGPQPPADGVDLTDIPYSPTSYQLELPPGFPSMNIPADNPLTEQGIDLGRHLFFDPILSVDSTISCASCHDPKFSFTDGEAFSTGVGGQVGTRSAMAIINAAFFENGLFWDGRAASLEDQALQPVENPIEMAESWDNVEEKLRRHPMYQKKFREAFGIKNSKEITRDLAAKAIAQFERILISANSKFDKKFYQNDPDPFLFSDLETDGYFI
ncbi:MAG: cytochrome C peroxidase, partial [Gammaproteobacteria bacterium]